MATIISLILIILICIIAPEIGCESQKKRIARYERMLHEATVKGDDETAQLLIQALTAMKRR